MWCLPEVQPDIFSHLGLDFSCSSLLCLGVASNTLTTLVYCLLIRANKCDSLLSSSDVSFGEMPWVCDGVFCVLYLLTTDWNLDAAADRNPFNILSFIWCTSQAVCLIPREWLVWSPVKQTVAREDSNTICPRWEWPTTTWSSSW